MSMTGTLTMRKGGTTLAWFQGCWSDRTRHLLQQGRAISGAVARWESRLEGASGRIFNVVAPRGECLECSRMVWRSYVWPTEAARLPKWECRLLHWA